MSMPEDTQIKAFDDMIKALYDANVLDYVCIPKPAAYVIHKLIINKDREDYKKEKDAEAISNILAFAANEDFISELKILFEMQNKKTKAKIIATCKAHASLHEFLNIFSD